MSEVQAGPEQLAARLHRALLERGQSVACAESLTGGELAAVLSCQPGASNTFLGGVVSYATAIKRELLGVTAERVVSGECATQMAVGVRDRLHADWALATTGVAGPDSQEDQPVGTVYVALAGPGRVDARRHALTGDRAGIRRQSCVAALQLLLEELRGG